MTAVAIPGDRSAAGDLTAQPVDNAGEKLGGTGGQPGKRRGEYADNRRRRHDSAQPACARRVRAYIGCGRGQPGRPGITAVVPTIHRTYYDYVLFFIYEPVNQQQAGVRVGRRPDAVLARPRLQAPGTGSARRHQRVATDVPLCKDPYTRAADRRRFAVKFQVERDVLAEAVAWTARALPARPALPVLAGMR